ncbi:hypothetical protein L6164_027204 [Bauhinia variegata]|uniref:Uncharacterized protein n=1 Tax=Bauhinia variegata TaxID=167791 RepID=A0ACB9LSW2_BAUVA|nr:hypothetical protein L6164_027204 [Bauhinia variegata]
MSWSVTSTLCSLPSMFDSSSQLSSCSLLGVSSFWFSGSRSTGTRYCKQSFSFSSLNEKARTLPRSHPTSSTRRLVTRAAEYKFPDPIPEFADAETEKFRNHLLSKLSKKDVYEESVEEVVGICTDIFNTFLHTEYGGPGTLLVIPFIDMADTVNERGLPGGPQAARAAVKWAQNNVDKDWKEWTGDASN